MATDDKLAKLLQKNIEASNRTTHAVRALVRFLFIQLAFLTAAFVLWQIGLAFPDSGNCTAFGCEPNLFVSFLVFALIITGVVLSSLAGWNELRLSSLPEDQEFQDSHWSAEPGLAVTLPNGNKVCPGCKKVYKPESKCEACDLWV
jgi:hypothetical protein